MSQDNASELSKLWSHEPHNHLRFKPGALVSEIDADATPGFTGSKSDAPALHAERNERFAG
ncbi:MAG: polyphosphate kinase, partial [Mycobacterium sp.]|nr:polyphosphate kinase [Mycobacterium sp.]